MKIVYYVYVCSADNYSDCLTTHLTHVPLWHLIKEHCFIVRKKTTILQWLLASTWMLEMGSVKLETELVQNTHLRLLSILTLSQTKKK
jgi:hypothetical protein